VSYPWKGRLTYSLLKQIAKSPAHFRLACDAVTAPTASMRMGTLVDWLLFGGPTPMVFELDKVRYPKEWRAWKAEHAGVETYGVEEMHAAREIAYAVQHAPHNVELWRKWLSGAEYHVELEWEEYGIPMRTRGVDVLRREDSVLVDYKLSRTAEPRRLPYVSRDFCYDEQLALYRNACFANGIEVRLCANFFTESSPPYVSVVRRVGPAVLREAKDRVLQWVLILKACLDSDRWHGYVEGGEVEAEANEVALEGLGNGAVAWVEGSEDGL
jgi:hypothetical protein